MFDIRKSGQGGGGYLLGRNLYLSPTFHCFENPRFREEVLIRVRLPKAIRQHYGLKLSFSVLIFKPLLLYLFNSRFEHLVSTEITGHSPFNVNISYEFSKTMH